MPDETHAQRTERVTGELARLIADAADRNAAAELHALSLHATGAYHATGHERYRRLANYATQMIVMATRCSRGATQH